MQRSTVRISLVLVSFAALSTLSSCASGRINLVRTAPEPGVFNRAQPILVGNFDASGATSLGDGHESDEVVETQLGRLSEDIERRLVEQLRERGFNASRLEESTPSEGAVIIDGRITLNDRGSWALRVFVGFGTGSTSLESSVRARRVGSDDSLAELDVHATSGGSAGWMGTGDFIPTDTQNTAIAIANYIAAQTEGSEAD